MLRALLSHWLHFHRSAARFVPRLRDCVDPPARLTGLERRDCATRCPFAYRYYQMGLMTENELARYYRAELALAPRGASGRPSRNLREKPVCHIRRPPG
jgi:hypothetical protein